MKEIIITQRPEKNKTLILDQDCLVFEHLKDGLPDKINTEIIVKDNVKVDYIFVLENIEDKTLLENRVIRLGLNSRLHNYYFYLNQNANVHLNTYIDTRADFQHQVLALTEGKQLVYLQENHNFLYPRAYGKFRFWAIAKDQSKIHTDSMVSVKKSAKNTEVSHNQHAWLISPEAKVELVPGLSVEPDEVKASHSAKVSNLACEQLFYLQSRGLNQENIKNLLITSISQLILNQLPSEVQKENLANILKKYYVNK